MNGETDYAYQRKESREVELQLNLLDKNMLCMLEICDFFQKMFLWKVDISPTSITTKCAKVQRN